MKSCATKGMTDNLSPPVLESALSVHECLVRRLVGHVRQVRPVRHYWCAAHASKALALDKWGVEHTNKKGYCLPFLRFCNSPFFFEKK